MYDRRRKRLVAIALTCLLCVTGCSNQTVLDNEPTRSVIENATITLEPEITETPTGEIEPSTEVLDDMKELSIYSIDSQSAEKISITAMVRGDKEITPEMIVDKVVESMADETFMIGIDEVTTEGDTVIVSFLDDQPPVTNVGSSVESEILDAIAQSLLDNLLDYHKVIFRVMGGPYQSGHIELDMDTVYLETK